MKAYIVRYMHRFADHALQALIAALLVGMGVGTDMLRIHLFVARADLIHYDRVEPTNTPAGGPLVFTSVVTARKPLDVRWLDILFCADESGTYERVSQHVAEAQDFSPLPKNGAEGEAVRRRWVYTGYVPPEVGRECYLQTTITVALRYGIRKRQLLIGPLFALRRTQADSAP